MSVIEDYNFRKIEKEETMEKTTSYANYRETAEGSTCSNCYYIEYEAGKNNEAGKNKCLLHNFTFLSTFGSPYWNRCDKHVDAKKDVIEKESLPPEEKIVISLRATGRTFECVADLLKGIGDEIKHCSECRWGIQSSSKNFQDGSEYTLTIDINKEL